MKTAENKFNFTKSLAELEAITTWFESDQVDLDQALAKFERGLELAAELKNHLGTIENRVEKIKQKFDTKPQLPESEEPLSEAPPDLFDQTL